MNINCSRNVLLLGAGFTKNFGGLLASEMWAEIFNHEKVQAQARIRQKMLEDFDYESIYNSVLYDNSFTEDEKTAIRDATKSAYEHIDNILMREFIHHDGHPPWTNTVNTLLLNFGNTNDNSFIFTLNQDIFIERFYTNPPDSSNRYYKAKLSIPGIDKKPEWFMNKYAYRRSKPVLQVDENAYIYYKLKEEDYYTLPTEEMLKNRKGSLLDEGSYFLIKLHGSHNWNSSDGSSAMVVGRGKTEKIQKEPLLTYYFDIFREVLSQEQRRLLIIGYGFGDEHINHEISNAVNNHGLKVYIVSPETPKDLKHKLCKSLEKSEDTRTIWNGVSGYFQCVEDVLLKAVSENQVMNEHFYEIFFGSNDL